MGLSTSSGPLLTVGGGDTPLKPQVPVPWSHEVLMPASQAVARLGERGVLEGPAKVDGTAVVVSFLPSILSVPPTQCLHVGAWKRGSLPVAQTPLREWWGGATPL